MRNKVEKTLLVVPTSDAHLAKSACAALTVKFGAVVNTYDGHPFVFTTQNTMALVMGRVPAVAIVAIGPWDLSGRERPALGTMQTFAEGVIAALRAVSLTVKPLSALIADAQALSEANSGNEDHVEHEDVLDRFCAASRDVLNAFGIE